RLVINYYAQRDDEQPPPLVMGFGLTNTELSADVDPIKNKDRCKRIEWLWWGVLLIDFDLHLPEGHL
ncbi:MAG: hypothetical protein LM523_08525, partial [Candidatus Contendobacter sp.]|nr:hypothetical protein [Candidatus Contendobacter sp.]